MKKIVTILLCLLCSHNINFRGATSSFKPMEIHKVKIETKVVDTDEKYKLLLEKLRNHESRGNSRIINKYNCMGLYQFKESTLRYLGYEISPNDFRTNSEVFPEWQQHEAALKFTKLNRRLLSRVIEKYEGKVVNGINITETGILAAAALAGAGGVKKYFSNNYNAKDGFGTSIEDMLIRFEKV